MTDIVSPQKRSEMMAGIKCKDTKPELIIRKLLFRRGFRYKLHDKNLPGKPDLVFPKYNAVIFINGCFWHCHDCKYFKWPKSNTEFWVDKLNQNKVRDIQKFNALIDLGWKVRIVWECSVRDKSDDDILKEIDKLSDWLSEYG